MPRQFSLQSFGCAWALRLVADTNQPGAISETTCDGTNTYKFVPDAGGTHSVGGILTPFQQSGSVRPGQVLEFGDRLGCLWWAYCSSCVLTGAEVTVPNFLGLPGGRNSKVRVCMESEGLPRSNLGLLGPSSVYAGEVPPAEDPKPLAHFEPLATLRTNGVEILTRWKVTTFCLDGAGHPTPQPSAVLVVEAQRIGLGGDTAAFLPRITGTAHIVDYRSPNAGEYLADHWLTAEERKRVPKAPLMPTDRASQGRLLRFLTLSVIVCLLAGIIFSRACRARVRT